MGVGVDLRIRDRQGVSPTILAVATILILTSMALLGLLELLRRRSTRMMQGPIGE